MVEPKAGSMKSLSDFLFFQFTGGKQMANRAQFVVALLAVIVVLSCELPATHGQGKYVVQDVENPEYRNNELFPAYDSYYSPRIWKLRARYNLNSVVSGETDEWKRIRLLRNWVYSSFNFEAKTPPPVRLEVFAILDASLKGAPFHCTHTSIALPAVLNSYGYLSRRLGCGYGLKDKGDFHGLNEVWVNKFCKWVLVDAEFDWHFEKNGVPLSALEIRNEVWKDGAKSVVRRFSPENKPITDQYKHKYIGSTAETYRWCSWETNTNRFTAFPSPSSSSVILYEDDIYRNNTWYRGGKPNWIYNTPYLITTTESDWIEWTPNTITSRVRLKDDMANVFLTSFTPNLRSYQVRRSSGPWVDCDESVELPLKKEGNRFIFRTMNLFGVTGPEHFVEITWENE
jgi:hypothetical protein